MAGLGPATQPSRVRAANGLDASPSPLKYAYMPSGFVYIMASKRNGTLYTGVTSQLIERVAAHREGRGSKFVTKYNVTKLVCMRSIRCMSMRSRGRRTSSDGTGP